MALSILLALVFRIVTLEELLRAISKASKRAQCPGDPLARSVWLLCPTSWPCPDGRDMSQART